MCSGRGNEPLRSLGFPIRKSPDQSLVTDSPGLIAGSYVLHRLLVPRHPPCALINLATTDDARVHCAVLKIRAVPDPQTPYGRGPGPSRGQADWRPFPQDPTACSARTNSLASFPSRCASSCLRNRPAGVLTDPGSSPNRITSAPLTSDHPGTNVRKMVLDAHPRLSRRARQLLLRKEVIQPHLPVRLPCYDFVPIAGPTFDGSLPYGLGHRLRVLPTFVT